METCFMYLFKRRLRDGGSPVMPVQVFNFIMYNFVKISGECGGAVSPRSRQRYRERGGGVTGRVVPSDGPNQSGGWRTPIRYRTRQGF